MRITRKIKPFPSPAVHVAGKLNPPPENSKPEHHFQAQIGFVLHGFMERSKR